MKSDQHSHDLFSLVQKVLGKPLVSLLLAITPHEGLQELNQMLYKGLIQSLFVQKSSHLQKTQRDQLIVQQLFSLSSIQKGLEFLHICEETR